MFRRWFAGCVAETWVHLYQFKVKQKDEPTPSIREIGKAIGHSRMSVLRALDVLEAREFVWWEHFNDRRLPRGLRRVANPPAEVWKWIADENIKRQRLVDNLRVISDRMKGKTPPPPPLPSVE
jgi:DNA-binding transcriptional MocR family regulator